MSEAALAVQLERKYVRRFFVTQTRSQHLVTMWVTFIMILVHVGLACAVIFADIERFSSDSFRPMIILSGGNLWIWGVFYLTSAALMSMPRKWMSVIGTWLGMCQHILWAVLFGIAMVGSPTAAPTAFPAYAGFATICAALLTAQVLEKQNPVV